jgi:hypothetical protein
MKRACVLGLLAIAAMGLTGGLAGCQSGTTEMAGFSECEGVWFNANGERVHRDQLLGRDSMHVQNSHGSTILLATDVHDEACRDDACGRACAKACCEQLGSRSASPRSSGYTRTR